jgi:hypothetical protein
MASALSRSASLVSATASATGGLQGFDRFGRDLIATAGNADAIARATGLSSVQSIARTGGAGVRTADALAVVTDEAPIREVQARMNGEIGGAGRLDAITGIAPGAGFPTIRIDPVASATTIGLATPGAEQLAALARDSIVGLQLESGGNALAIGMMGSQGVGQTFGTDLAFSLTPELIGDDDDKRLVLDLIRPVFSADAFGSLHFAVTVDGVARVDRSFSAPSEALAFFSDNRIDLADLEDPAAGPSRVELALDAAVPNGFGFPHLSFQFALLTVPEPGAMLLLLLTLGGLAYRRALLYSALGPR